MTHTIGTDENTDNPIYILALNSDQIRFLEILGIENPQTTMSSGNFSVIEGPYVLRVLDLYIKHRVALIDKPTAMIFWREYGQVIIDARENPEVDLLSFENKLKPTMRFLGEQLSKASKSSIVKFKVSTEEA